eukprot:scaffold654874_cov79-Attheya_sp.AAC.1
MAESTALQLHDNQPFQDQRRHAVHPWKAPTMAHLTAFVCALGKNAPSYEDTVFILDLLTSFLLPLSSTHALQGKKGP